LIWTHFFEEFSFECFLVGVISFQIVILFATFLNTITLYYVVLASIEFGCLVLIIWFAFKWLRLEA